MVFGEEVGEAELLFEADDAVLVLQGVHAHDAGENEEHDRHDDPPEVEALVDGPGVDGRPDREEDVQQRQGREEEVERRVEARVVLERLRLGHSCDDSSELVKTSSKCRRNL